MLVKDVFIIILFPQLVTLKALAYTLKPCKEESKTIWTHKN